MSSRRNLWLVLIAAAVSGLLLVAFAAGLGTAWLLLRDRAQPPDEPAGFELFWQAWDLVEAHFLGELPDAQHLAWGAIRGALETLDDPHTVFLEPKPRQREKEELSGRFGGIGALVSKAEDGSILLEPMPDLPAERAGVREGDAVLKVDDTEIGPEATVDEVVTLIRGQVGTVVRLTLRHAGETEPFEVEIRREEIPTPSAEWRMVEGTTDVGYVRLIRFADPTGSELKKAIAELREEGMARLVLDLRGNGGGLLGAAVDVASEFLADGVILYQQQTGSGETALQAKRGGSFTDGPLVVLVDGGTASAAEIVAGALQDRKRAELVGQKTFGKGSVQSVFDLRDGSSVHITSAEWLTPNRNQITGQGLTPGLEVEFTEEDRAAGRDPQLERAVEHLKSLP